MSNDTNYKIRIKASSEHEADAISDYLGTPPRSHYFNVEEVNGLTIRATGFRNENSENRPLATDLGWLMHTFPKARVSYQSKGEYGYYRKEVNMSGRRGAGISMSDEDRIWEIQERDIQAIRAEKDLIFDFLHNRRDSKVIRRAITLAGKLALDPTDLDGAEARAGLLPLLTLSELNVALPAATVLTPLAHRDSQVLNAVLLVLEQAFKTHDGVQQAEAANVVKLLGPTAVSLLPILVAGLQEKARSAAVIRAIGSMGTAARSAQGVLLVTLDDQDPWVVAEAAHALRRIGQLEAKVSKKLEELLEDKEWMVRKEAICALLTRGQPTSEPAREKLVSGIRGPRGRDECSDGIKMLADLPISLVRDIFLQDLIVQRYEVLTKSS
jgi:HEAT repeat protein